MANDNRNAGKGMGPKKGYNYKNWSEGWDHINWSDPPEIVVRIDENTVGYLEKPKKDKENDGRTEETNGTNG